MVDHLIEHAPKIMGLILMIQDNKLLEVPLASNLKVMKLEILADLRKPLNYTDIYTVIKQKYTMAEIK